MTFVRADGVAGNRSDNFPRCGNGDKNRHNIKALLKAFWRQHCVFICAARVAAFVALEGRTQAAKNATAVVHRRQADRECRLLERLIRRLLLPKPMTHKESTRMSRNPQKTPRVHTS